MSPTKTGPRVVIIGGGPGGLSFAIALKRQLHLKTSQCIYEKSPEIGGTWRDNTYPGCGSDTPTHWFSLSTDLNPNWSVTHPPQAEIWAYWAHLARKYALHDRIVTNARVAGAKWDTTRQLYEIEIEDVRSGKRTSTSAHILVSAIGILSEPAYPPELTNLNTFKGALFHSAQWDHSVDLRDKRVAVVGNGCSSAQFIPHLVADPTVHVVNFCRTPSWFIYRPQSKYSARQKWVFAHVPLAIRLYRIWLMFSGYVWSPFLTDIRNRIYGDKEQNLINFIKRTAPSEYHEKLIPTYPSECRRVVMEAGYLASLHRPNLDLNWDGIAEVTEEGILTQKNETISFDVIIFGTGFMTDTHPVPITGSHGYTLQEYCITEGGPTAYLGVTVPGFPNFYWLAGPNTTTSPGSVVFTTECQINYAIQLAAPVLRGLACSFDVTPAACTAYNTALQAALDDSDFVQCRSWYRTGHTGKNFGIFPGHILRYWWLLRAPKWEHYNAVGAEKWVRWLKVERIARVAGLFAFVCGCTWAFRGKVFR
ncbi:hypothetical protein B0H21DRAFT_763709 [Amylocystis lapponica]|nr:hypothetical protein B0H21DRAFT_763709 [Amylocystis lapponica]